MAASNPASRLFIVFRRFGALVASGDLEREERELAMEGGGRLLTFLRSRCLDGSARRRLW